MTKDLILGVLIGLLAQGHLPRAVAWLDRAHRRLARRTQQRGLPLPSGAERHLHAAQARDHAHVAAAEQHEPRIRPPAPVAIRRISGEHPTVQLEATQ